jgi:TolB-like protein
MKKAFLLPALLLSFVLPAYTVSFRIALSDFAVHSKNPKYEYMGKGISEMIAVELAKSTGLDLIEREKRAEMLEEIEFALSDLADATRQVEVGKMLAAKYLVFGEIIDMDKDVLISLRMVEVETAEIVWIDQVVTNIANYDYITGFFTESILKYLGLSVPRSTVAKVESIKAKDEDAVVAFSKAVDAYDRKENAAAREELVRARRIDPDNEAVRLYLSKLLVNLSKFKIEAAALQLPSQNPAYLGFLQYAQVAFMVNVSDMLSDEVPYLHLEEYDLYYWNQFGHWTLGYSAPLGKTLGYQTNIFGWSPNGEELRTEEDPGEAEYQWYDLMSWGTQFSLGWAISDRLAFGVSTSVFLAVNSGGYEQSPKDPPQVQSAFCLGAVVKNLDSTVVFDILSGYSFSPQYLLLAQELADYRDLGIPYTMGASVALPLLLEGSVTFALLDRRIYLLVRQRNDIFLDQASYSGRITIGAELWAAKWFAIRGAVELSEYKMEDLVIYGMGGTGGVALRSTRWASDLELGLSYRMEPVRSLPGEVVYQPVLYISLTKNLLSKAR